MNKEMQKLLKQINDKKNAVRSLANEGKMDEARKAKAELVELQDKFNLLADLEDDDLDGIEGSLNDGRAKDITGGAVDKVTKKKEPCESVRQYCQVWFLKERTGRGRRDGLQGRTVLRYHSEQGRRNGNRRHHSGGHQNGHHRTETLR